MDRGEGEHHDRSGQAGGGGGSDDGDERDEQVVHDRELDPEELRDEDRGDRGVDRGAPVHLGGGAEGDGEGGVGPWDSEVAVRHPLGHGKGPEGGAGDAWYNHMYARGLYVEEGQTVTAGQVIAGVGNNGRSTGPHLHFEVHTDDDLTTTDPMAWLAQQGAVDASLLPTTG